MRSLDSRGIYHVMREAAVYGWADISGDMGHTDC